MAWTSQPSCPNSSPCKVQRSQEFTAHYIYTCISPLLLQTLLLLHCLLQLLLLLLEWISPLLLLLKINFTCVIHHCMHFLSNVVSLLICCAAQLLQGQSKMLIGLFDPVYWPLIISVNCKAKCFPFEVLHKNAKWETCPSDQVNKRSMWQTWATFSLWTRKQTSPSSLTHERTVM